MSSSDTTSDVLKKRIAYFEASGQLSRREVAYFASVIAATILYLRFENGASTQFGLWCAYALVLVCAYGAMVVSFITSHHLIQIDRHTRLDAFGKTADEKHLFSFPGSRSKVREIGILRGLMIVLLGSPTGVHDNVTDFETAIARFQRRVYVAKLLSFVLLSGVFFPYAYNHLFTTPEPEIVAKCLELLSASKNLGNPAVVDLINAVCSSKT